MVLEQLYGEVLKIKPVYLGYYFKPTGVATLELQIISITACIMYSFLNIFTVFGKY